MFGTVFSAGHRGIWTATTGGKFACATLPPKRTSEQTRIVDVSTTLRNVASPQTIAVLSPHLFIETHVQHSVPFVQAYVPACKKEQHTAGVQEVGDRRQMQKQRTA